MWNQLGENSPLKRSAQRFSAPNFSILMNNYSKKAEIFSQTQPDTSDLGPHSEFIENYYKQLNEAIASLDEKLQGVIDKRESSYIAAFRNLMRKIEKDFITIKRALELRETQHAQELEMLGEDAIRKQLTYFREECLELNNLNQKSKERITFLERKVKDQEAEIDRLNAIVTHQVKQKVQTAKWDTRIQSARNQTRSTSPYHSRLQTSDTSPKAKRSPLKSPKSPKYSHKHIDGTFLKDVFLITMQESLNIPKDNLITCVDRLVELVVGSVESKAKEVQMIERKLEKMKSYYHSRMKNVLGGPFAKPLDDLLFHFWEIFNSYKDKAEASPYSPSGSTNGFNIPGYPKRSVTPEIDKNIIDTARSSQKSFKQLSQADKIKIMEDFFDNSNVLNILSRYSDNAKVLSQNRFRFYGLTSKEAQLRNLKGEEELNEVEVNSHNEPTFGGGALPRPHHELGKKITNPLAIQRSVSQPRIVADTSPKGNLLSELFEITKSARPYTVRPPTSNKKTRDKKYFINVAEHVEPQSVEDTDTDPFPVEDFLNQPPKIEGKIEFQRNGRKYVPLPNQSSED